MTYDREGYMAYRRLGICTGCHVNMAVKGRALCVTCAEKRRERRKATDKPKAARAARQSLRDQRRLDGLCVRCGVNPSRVGKTLCKTCAKLSSAWQRMHHAEVCAKRETDGVCIVCGVHPPAEGIRMCEQCRKKAHDKYAARRKLHGS